MITKRDAEEIYLQIKNKLKGYDGKIIAIDVESGDYFVGNDTLDAYEKARKKHPSSEFFFKRIGSKTAYVVGTVQA